MNVYNITIMNLYNVALAHLEIDKVAAKSGQVVLVPFDICNLTWGNTGLGFFYDKISSKPGLDLGYG